MNRHETPIAATALHTPTRHDSGPKHVSGTAEYIDDMIEPAGTMHAYLALSTRAHAEIVAIDLDAVRAAPGVIGVLTADDIPGENDVSPSHKHDEPIFAMGKVQFWGQPIFAVIAETRDAARRAAQLAKVDYADLDWIPDVRAAQGRGALGQDEEVGAKVARTIFPGTQGGPLMHVIAGKAVAFGEALTPEFRDYTRRVLENAAALAAALAERGYRIVSGGTDNHLFLVDLRPQGINGNTASKRLDKVGISVSKSMIPFDPEKPWITSGIRIGTPAITTRGFTTAEMAQVAALIDRGLKGDDVEAVAAEVRDLAARHPMP